MTRSVLLSVVIGWSVAASCLAADRMPIPESAEPRRGSLPAQLGDNGHAPARTHGVSEYRIGPEDVLNISVWNNSAISRTVPVRPDGKISLPLINDVHAAGLTPNQLRMVLMKKLADYVPSPEVSVIVEEVHSFKVSVIGEVKKTGRHELKGGATVLDVLALGEGFGDFASRARIVVLRPEGKTMRQIPFNYNKVISSDGVLENFLLQPGDIVVVP
ncbi:MAG TPA: polysaccharide biosynthesis/export family protein [Nitrospira sp.]|nr:polysaccharide biosynthesis/export family protein [Nitrospira sp.]